MKVLALVLLLVAAAQARSAPVESKALEAFGKNRSVVHIRLAVATSGLLNTCAGSLISNRHVLTSASCVAESRFIWLRYGANEVIRPALVSETSNVVVNPNADLAILNANRFIESTESIAPIDLADADEDLPEIGEVCVYGASENGGPGETLKCLTVELAADGDDILATAEEGQITSFDIGAMLVAGGKQVGVLIGAPTEANGAARFLKVSKNLDWINTEAQMEGSRVMVVNN